MAGISDSDLSWIEEMGFDDFSPAEMAQISAASAAEATHNFVMATQNGSSRSDTKPQDVQRRHKDTDRDRERHTDHREHDEDRWSRDRNTIHTHQQQQQQSEAAGWTSSSFQHPSSTLKVSVSSSPSAVVYKPTSPIAQSASAAVYPRYDQHANNHPYSASSSMPTVSSHPSSAYNRSSSPADRAQPTRYPSIYDVTNRQMDTGSNNYHNSHATASSYHHHPHHSHNDAPYTRESSSYTSTYPSAPSTHQSRSYESRSSPSPHRQDPNSSLPIAIAPSSTIPPRHPGSPSYEYHSRSASRSRTPERTSRSDSRKRNKESVSDIPAPVSAATQYQDTYSRSKHSHDRDRDRDAERERVDYDRMQRKSYDEDRRSNGRDREHRPYPEQRSKADRERNSKDRSRYDDYSGSRDRDADRHRDRERTRERTSDRHRTEDPSRGRNNVEQTSTVNDTGVETNVESIGAALPRRDMSDTDVSSNTATLQQATASVATAPRLLSVIADDEPADSVTSTGVINTRRGLTVKKRMRDADEVSSYPRRNTKTSQRSHRASSSASSVSTSDTLSDQPQQKKIVLRKTSAAAAGELNLTQAASNNAVPEHAPSTTPSVSKVNGKIAETVPAALAEAINKTPSASASAPGKRIIKLNRTSDTQSTAPTTASAPVPQSAPAVVVTPMTNSSASNKKIITLKRSTSTDSTTVNTTTTIKDHGTVSTRNGIHTPIPVSSVTTNATNLSSPSPPSSSSSAAPSFIVSPSISRTRNTLRANNMTPIISLHRDTDTSDQHNGAHDRDDADADDADEEMTPISFVKPLTVKPLSVRVSLAGVERALAAAGAGAGGVAQHTQMIMQREIEEPVISFYR